MPHWIQLGGFTLAAMGGCINAVGLLCVKHRAVSHLSGTLTNIGIEIANHDYRLIREALLIAVFFFLGCVLSGLMIRQSTLKAGRRYGVTLMVESVVLAFAAVFLHHGSDSGLYAAAMGCGLQNAMATSYSGAVIRTTHITGMITDLGIAIGLTARGLKADWRRMRLYLVLLSGFLLGGTVGAFGYAEIGSLMLLFPASAAGVVGIGYTIWKQFWPHTVPASVRAHGSTRLVSAKAEAGERT